MTKLSKTFAIGFLAILLSGCVPNRVGYGITCPPLTKYSDAFLARAEVQVDLIEKVAPDVVTMVNDYGVTRDAIRKCMSLEKAERAKGTKAKKK